MRDVMVTIVESGMNCLWYWNDPVNIDRDSDLNVTGMVVYEDDGETEQAHTVIDGPRIAAAIGNILAGHVNLAHTSSPTPAMPERPEVFARPRDDRRNGDRLTRAYSR